MTVSFKLFYNDLFVWLTTNFDLCRERCILAIMRFSITVALMQSIKNMWPQTIQSFEFDCLNGLCGLLCLMHDSLGSVTMYAIRSNKKFVHVEVLMKPDE